MSRGAFIVAALLLLLGVVLRWWGLGERSLWFDEGYTQWVASLPLGRLIHAIRYDYTPPLYFMIASWWSWLFGDSEFALRSWSALCASLAMLLVALVAWKATRNAPATLFATGVFAVSQIQLEWGQTARAYATASFVFILCVWLLIRWIDTTRRLWLILFALGAAGLVYQHNVMWFFLVGLNLGALVWPGKPTLRQRFVAMVVANAIVGVCFLPWLSGFLQQLRQLEHAYFTERPGFYDLTIVAVQQIGIHLDRLRSLGQEQLGIADVSYRLYRLGFFALAVVLGGIAIFRAEPSTRRRLLALFAFAGFPMLLGFAYSNLRTSVWVEKTFIPASTILPILLGASVAAAGPVLLRAACQMALAVIVLAAGITSVDFLARPPLEDWRSATRWVPSGGTQGLGVVFVGSAGEVLYRYYSRRLDAPMAEAAGLPVGYFETDPPMVMTRVTSEGDLAELNKLMAKAGVQRIVLIQAYTKWADPYGLAQSVLDQRWRLVENRDYGSVRGRRYERPEESAVAPVQID